MTVQGRSGILKPTEWFQEELTRQLKVSRQAVSKWEGAQSTPDLDKALQLAKLFEVSTDCLLKDEPKEAERVDAPDAREPRRRPGASRSTRTRPAARGLWCCRCSCSSVRVICTAFFERE